MKIIFLNQIMTEDYIASLDLDELRIKFCNYLINHHFCKQIDSFESVDGCPTDSKFDDFAYNALLCSNDFYYYEFMYVDILDINNELFLIIEDLTNG